MFQFFVANIFSIWDFSFFFFFLKSWFRKETSWIDYKNLEQSSTCILRTHLRQNRERSRIGEEMTVHLTWIKVSMFLHFMLYSVVRVLVCQIHWKFWSPQHILCSHRWQSFVPLVLSNENKVETFFFFLITVELAIAWVLI